MRTVEPNLIIKGCTERINEGERKITENCN